MCTTVHGDNHDPRIPTVIPCQAAQSYHSPHLGVGAPDPFLESVDFDLASRASSANRLASKSARFHSPCALIRAVPPSQKRIGLSCGQMEARSQCLFMMSAGLVSDRINSNRRILAAIASLASVRWQERALWRLCSFEWGMVAKLTTDSLCWATTVKILLQRSSSPIMTAYHYTTRAMDAHLLHKEAPCAVPSNTLLPVSMK